MNTYADKSIRNKKAIMLTLGKEGHDVTMSGNDYFKVEEPFWVDLAEPKVKK